MRAGEIPLSWIHLVGKMGAKPLLTLLDECERQGIPPQDLDRVRAAWDEIVRKGTAREQEIAVEIARLNERLRALRDERTAIREARGERP